MGEGYFRKYIFKLFCTNLELTPLGTYRSGTDPRLARTALERYLSSF